MPQLWIILLSLFALFTTGFSGDSYELRVPPEYTAFSGDLTFFYGIPDDISLPNAFVRIVLVTDGTQQEITTLGIGSKYKSGNLSVTCGILEVAGKYEFQLTMHSGGPILSRSAVIVRWPSISMTIPDSVYAQSSPVPLNITSPAVCNARLKRYSFRIDVEFAENSSGIHISGREEIIHTIEFHTFVATGLIVHLPCSLFDLPGIYRASLKSSTSAISVIARSNHMLTSLNPKYQIHIWSPTVFPCHNIFSVNYMQPLCPGSADVNKIRIYMLRRKSSGTLALPLEKTYVQERPADPDQTSFKLNCSFFQTTSSGYCFQYVTVARTKAVINQTEVCLSAHADSDMGTGTVTSALKVSTVTPCVTTQVLPIDGGWGQWSVWSECSVRCGAGRRSRYRMCDSPTPNFGGAFCEGDNIQRKSCDVFCPESIPHTPLHAPKINLSCTCGCVMSQETGEVIASGRCDGVSDWLISVEKDRIIRLKFKYLNLFPSKQSVRVRNGDTPDSDLLAFSEGDTDIAEVTSTSNHLLVEFRSNSGDPVGSTSVPGDSPINVVFYPAVPTKPIHVYGFIASYSTEENDSPIYPVSVQPIRKKEKTSLWESTVTIVGICLCGLVVITAITFVIYHRTCYRNSHKYAMAAHDESPKRMCKSTSMPSSPSHESHPGIEIEHDMEVPLTNLGNIGDKRRARTPGSTKSKSSLAATTPSGVKKVKTIKADIEHGGGTVRQSPRSPYCEYSQLPQKSSQKKKSRSHDLVLENEHSGLFRTSPLLKQKVPRSPKVHPSSKSKHIIQSKTPTNDNSLTRTKNVHSNREDNSSDISQQRVVMGSDHTPTSSVKSPPSESSKLDCETPTNINADVVFRKHSKSRSHDVLDNGYGSPAGSHDLKSKSGDINLKDLSKENENGRKPASGTSEDSVSAEAGSQMTTSFMDIAVRPRRPTSLTESYSKMSLSSSQGLLNGETSKNSSDGAKDKQSVTSKDDRQNALPKPDGQSPKSPRIEEAKLTSSSDSSPLKHSKNSTPKSIRSLRSDKTDMSNKTKSPARSINTPSDVVELEYDDFIDMDDTYSYFDPIETEKLTWHGVEKVKVKTPKNDTPSKQPS